MKRTLLSLFLVAGLTAFADHPDHLKATGHAVYKTGKNVEVKKGSMYVPKSGKGKLILEVDGKEVESDKTRLVKIGGRDIFYVQFTSVPGSPKDSVTLLRGTLLKGENMGVYYGDFFMKQAAARAPGKKVADIEIDEETASCLVDGSCGDGNESEDVASVTDTVESADVSADDEKEWADCTGGKCPHKGGSMHRGRNHRHHGGHHHHGRGRHHRHGHGWTYGGGFGFHAKFVVTK